MSKKPDNPQVFPKISTAIDYDRGTKEFFENTFSEGGMTLLDHFAGQALIGVIANSKVEEMRLKEFDDKYTDKQQTEALVKFCYNTAKAMLIERDKRLNRD